MATELLEETQSILVKLEKDMAALETQTLLSGPYDTTAAVGQITAGAGGTDAQDWAEMLLNLYRRWASSKADFKYVCVCQKSLKAESAYM